MNGVDQKLRQKLDEWHEQNEHQKIVNAIALSREEQTDYETVSRLARALNNLGAYEEAARWLLAVEKDGEGDPLWHFRLGYSYYYLELYDKAAAAFGRSLELDASDEDAWRFLTDCLHILSEDEALDEVAEHLQQTDPALWEELFVQQEDEEEAYCPELYTEEEIEAVEAHIEAYFGKIDSVFHELVSPDIHVDIMVIAPDEHRNYYTLVTCGMGAHRMDVPEALEEEGLDRAELLICLPPDWKLHDTEEAWYWPLRWLKILARLPGEEQGWLGWGHTIPNGGPFADNTELSGILLLAPVQFEEGAGECILPDGDSLRFYQLMPLYEQEMDYKVANDTESLLELFDEEISPVVDIRRKNCCAFLSGKKFAKKPSEIRRLLTDWEEPEGCLATDRIMVDGCPVGYMYRETPQPGVPDSGWRFLAGDEDDDYMENAGNHGVYALDTVCNYDPDILPYLHAPVGSAFYRDEQGRFQRDDELDAEEELQG